MAHKKKRTRNWRGKSLIICINVNFAERICAEELNDV